MRGWRFENASGDILNLNDGSRYQVVGFGGIGIPDVRPTTEVLANREGSVLRSARINSRQLRIVVEIEPTDPAIAEDSVQVLLAHVAGSQGRDTPRVGTMHSTDFGGTQRSLRCAVLSGMRLSIANIIANATGYLVPLGFIASHPFWYDPVLQRVGARIGRPGQLGFPVEFPWNFGSDSPTAIIDPNYQGTAITHSLEWIVNGPSSGPSIENVTHKRVFRFNPSFVVPATQRLHVRFGWRPDGDFDIRAELADASDNRVNIIGNITAASRPIFLSPGSNTLVMTQTNENESLHTVEWYNEYLEG